mgnify:CR=1 FL=1
MSVVNLSLNRREFLGAATATAGALLVGFHFPAARAAAGGTINAYVSIDAAGQVTLMNPFIEMGQGTWTAIPMILAEELDVDMSAVRVADAPLGPEYRLLFGKTMRITGGSASVRGSYDTLRETGASAPLAWPMLIQCPQGASAARFSSCAAAPRPSTITSAPPKPPCTASAKRCSAVTMTCSQPCARASRALAS